MEPEDSEETEIEIDGERVKGLRHLFYLPLYVVGFLFYGTIFLISLPIHILLRIHGRRGFYVYRKGPQWPSFKLFARPRIIFQFSRKKPIGPVKEGQIPYYEYENYYWAFGGACGPASDAHDE